MALNVRNKLGFIDGTISKPSLDHRDFGSWSRCNDIVATWLMNSVSKKIGQSLLFISTAEGTKWEILQQRSRVTKFLMGLNESYEQTRRHILMLKPIPTIEEAFNIVTQDERQKTLKPVSKVDTVAFQAVASTNAEDAYIAAYNTMKTAQRPICSNCGKLGHTVQKCFKILGYPPGYKTNYRSNNALNQPRMQMIQPQNQAQPRPFSQNVYSAGNQRTNAIANVYAEAVAYPCEMEAVNNQVKTSNDVKLQDLSPQQLQNLVSQFHAQFKIQEPLSSSSVVPSPTATISEHGLMTHTSAGTFSGLDDWEG